MRAITVSRSGSRELSRVRQTSSPAHGHAHQRIVTLSLRGAKSTERLEKCSRSRWQEVNCVPELLVDCSHQLFAFRFHLQVVLGENLPAPSKGH